MPCMAMAAPIDRLSRIVVIRKDRNFERGQGLVEYALLIMFIAFLGILAIGALALAINRSYGLVGGALGVRKDVQTTQNNIYFDTNTPRCGLYHGSTRQMHMQFFSDIAPQYLTATTENPDIVLSIETIEPPPVHGSGLGNLKIEYYGPDGVSGMPMDCPQSLVIQSDAAHGSRTVVWHVLQ